MKKIHGSSSGFMKGRRVFTDYDSGCLRKLLASTQTPKPQIEDKYQILGANNEQRFEDSFQQQGLQYKREEPIRECLDSVDDVWFSGRCDFLIGSDVNREVIELKATSSKRKYQLLREGRYVTENLAQIVAYMVELDVTEGHLIYSYYRDYTDPDPVLDRDYLVSVSESGDILVNDAHSGFTVADYLAHRNAAIDTLVRGTVHDRPAKFDAKFGSPCEYCPFKRACDVYDNGLVSDFLSAVHTMAGFSLTSSNK